MSTKIIELSEALKALAAVQANGDTYVNYEINEVIRRLMEEVFEYVKDRSGRNEKRNQ